MSEEKKVSKIKIIEMCTFSCHLILIDADKWRIFPNFSMKSFGRLEVN